MVVRGSTSYVVVKGTQLYSEIKCVFIMISAVQTIGYLDCNINFN